MTTVADWVIQSRPLALGALRLTPFDFYAMTPGEFRDAAKGFRLVEAARAQVIGWAAASTVPAKNQGASKKNIRMMMEAARSFFGFETKEVKKVNVTEMLPEQVSRAADEVVERLKKKNEG